MKVDPKSLKLTQPTIDEKWVFHLPCEMSFVGIAILDSSGEEEMRSPTRF